MDNQIVQYNPQQQQLVSYNDVEKMAKAMALSGLFGFSKPEQALALMLIAQAEGLHPAIAARDYHIINGKPTLKADAMLARFMNAGGKVEWVELTESIVSARFTHPSGGSALITWTIEMAKHAGLDSPTWKKYPRQMLRSRVVSEGVRTVNPGSVVGIYTEDEVVHMVNADNLPVLIPPKEEGINKASLISNLPSLKLAAIEKVGEPKVSSEVAILTGTSKPMVNKLSVGQLEALTDMLISLSNEEIEEV